MYNYAMRIRLTKWGNSLGIRLPKVFAVNMGMRPGDAVRMEIRDKSLILSKEESLEEILAHITPEMLHRETDTGDFQGREVW